MTRFRLPAAMLAVILLGVARLGAQVPLTVSIDRPDRTLDVASFTTFHVYVANPTSRGSQVRAIRIVNELPGADWTSSICSRVTCYPEAVDTTETEPIAPQGATGFQIHVMTGARYGDTATIVMRIDTGDGSSSVERTVTVVTAPPPPQYFRIEASTLEKSVAVGDTAEFLVWAYNQAGDTLGLAVERVEDYFTGEGWESRLCVEETCYDPGAATPPSVLLENDRATSFRLRVHAGSSGRGQVVLRFSTGRGADPIEQRFTVSAGSSGVESATGVVTTARPSPATSIVRLPIPAHESARGAVTVSLFAAATGARVDARIVEGDDRGMVGVDVTTLAAGSYLYRVENGAASAVGRFQVVR